MKRLLGFLLQAALFIALAVWLADRPGTATIAWHDYVIETSAAFLGLVVLAVAFIFYMLFRLWHLLRHGPELWRLNRQLRKLKQGQDDLTQGLVAIAGGEAAEAGRLAVSARKKLGVTTATMLLQAQAAQLAQDHRAARGLFRVMLEDEESAVLGYRGLIMEARRAGDWGEVERLAAEMGRAGHNVPWHGWVQFEMAARRLAWSEAGQVLARLVPTRLLDGASLRRYRAAVLTAQSQEDAVKNDSTHALELAEQAAKQAPDWLPGLINLAQRQAAGGHKRALRRTVEKAWAVQPHPALVEALRSSDQRPIDFYKQIDHLHHDHEGDPASLLAVAQAAMEADIWGEVRRHLMALLASGQATQAAYHLFAWLERRESGDERAASAWLTKAIEAPPGPAWLCSACGGAQEDWQATCRACGAFASLEWRRPGVSKTSGAAAPLLSDWS